MNRNEAWDRLGKARCVTTYPDADARRFSASAELPFGADEPCSCPYSKIPKPLRTHARTRGRTVPPRVLPYST